MLFLSLNRSPHFHKQGAVSFIVVLNCMLFSYAEQKNMVTFTKREMVGASSLGPKGLLSTLQLNTNLTNRF